MLKHDTSKKLVAIGFPGSTYRDLQYFIQQEHQLDVGLINPREFLTLTEFPDQYINLVTHADEMPLKKQVSDHLDTHAVNRFTYVHNTVFLANLKIGNGVFMYPNSMAYPDAEIEDDVIVHGLVGLSHRCRVGKGSFISGRTGVSGGVNIGQYCWIGQCVIFYDNLEIPDFTTIGAMSVITKTITEPGTWTTVYNKKLVKM
jgi:acetyltransferase-like isoleucine patch superfamily enzyme